MKRERKGREGGSCGLRPERAPAHYHPSSIPRMHLVTYPVKMRTKYSCVQGGRRKRKGTKCERGYSGHLCRDRHLPDSSREMHCRCQERRAPLKSGARCHGKLERKVAEKGGERESMAQIRIFADDISVAADQRRRGESTRGHLGTRLPSCNRRSRPPWGLKNSEFLLHL